MLISTLTACGVSVASVVDDDDTKWGMDVQGTRVWRIERELGGRGIVGIGDNAQRREGAHRFYRGQRDGTLAVDTSFSNWKPADGGQRNNEFVSLQKKELKALAVYPLLRAIAARLTPELRHSRAGRSAHLQAVRYPGRIQHRDRLACRPGVLGDLQLRQDDIGADSVPLGERHAQPARGDGGEPRVAS